MGPCLACRASILQDFLVAVHMAFLKSPSSPYCPLQNSRTIFEMRTKPSIFSNICTLSLFFFSSNCPIGGPKWHVEPLLVHVIDIFCSFMDFLSSIFICQDNSLQRDFVNLFSSTFLLVCRPLFYLSLLVFSTGLRVIYNYYLEPQAQVRTFFKLCLNERTIDG